MLLAMELEPGDACRANEPGVTSQGREIDDGSLRGNWKGRHSIRVNDQWRIVFRWTASGPADVQLLDYH